MSKRFALAIAVAAGAGISVYMFLNWKSNQATSAPPFSARELYGDKIPHAPVAKALAPVDPKQPIRVAIGWLGLADEERNQEVADLAVAELSSAKNLDLVERQSLDKALGEAKISLAGLVRAATAVRVGKLLKADWFLLGSVAPVKGGSVLVARLVDVRSGVMRDVAVFPSEPSAQKLASGLAEFARRSREAASGSKPRRYLTLGSILDPGVSGRYPGFASQLRFYLTAAYAGTDITILEREYADVLFQEMRLDLAGLTEGSSSNAAVAFQSAFWTVNGKYQSYETTNLEMELSLDVVKTFAGATNLFFRGVPGDPFFRRVKSALDQWLEDKNATSLPSRADEARVQMNSGLRLIGNKSLFEFYTDVSLVDRSGLPEAERGSPRLREAIRAFETVLLLEPRNREAKLYLAICLRDRDYEYDQDVVRNYCREVLEEPSEDPLAKQAKALITWTFTRNNPGERAQWYGAAVLNTANAVTAKFYQREADRALGELALKDAKSANHSQAVEVHLFEMLRSRSPRGSFEAEPAVAEFVQNFGPVPAAAVHRLNELLPEMKAAVSNSNPALLAVLARRQADTNSPVIAEFERTLEWSRDHAETVPKADRDDYFGNLYSAYEWSWTNKLYRLTTKIAEVMVRLKEVDSSQAVDDETRMKLAYAYRGEGRWKEALAVYESYSNRPVYLGNSGPWGPAFSVLRTSYSANLCRKNLGIPEVHEEGQFEFEDTGWCFCTPAGAVDGLQRFNEPNGTFAVSDNAIWLAHDGQLIVVGPDMRTNFVVRLPMDPSTPISSISLGSSWVWVGTQGAGLMEVDKASRECRQLTQKDGLMMDFIASLLHACDSLWIGYGRQASGGLGRMELASHRITSLARSLNWPSERDKMPPPQDHVSALAAGADGDVWMVAGRGLKWYKSQQNVWDGEPRLKQLTGMAANGRELIVAKYEDAFREGRSGLGIRILDLTNGQWREIPALPGIPSMQADAIALDGPNIWVAGMGYVALVDPVRMKVLRVAYVSARHVGPIAVGGGYLWAQINWRLYRTPIH
jgi:Curli production assembly/transport component CsgG